MCYLLSNFLINNYFLLDIFEFIKKIFLFFVFYIFFTHKWYDMRNNI